jgi:hypothetical protein
MQASPLVSHLTHIPRVVEKGSVGNVQDQIGIEHLPPRDVLEDMFDKFLGSATPSEVLFLFDALQARETQPRLGSHSGAAIAFAKLEDVGRPGRPFLQWRILNCPYCRKTHLHGGGGASGRDPRSFLGFRGVHCKRPDADHLTYELIDAYPRQTTRLVAGRPLFDPHAESISGH